MLTIAKEYHCTTCSQSFTTQQHLNEHRKESSTCGIVGLKTHDCKGCGATFQYMKDLTDHARFCGGLKCTTCDKDVYNIVTWTRHCSGNEKLKECCAPQEQMPCPHNCGETFAKGSVNGPQHCFSCPENPRVQKMVQDMQGLPENHLPIVLHRRLAEDGEYDRYKSTKPIRVVLLRKATPTRVDLAHVEDNNGARKLITMTKGFAGYIIPDQTQQTVRALLKDVAELLQQKEWGDDGNELCELCQEYHDDEKDWIACSGKECLLGWVCRKVSNLDDAAFDAECARGDDDEWFCPACRDVQDVQEGGGASSSMRTLAVCRVCKKQSYDTLTCSAVTCKEGGAVCKVCAEKQGLPTDDRSTFQCSCCDPGAVRRTEAAHAAECSRHKARIAAQRERNDQQWTQQQVAKRERDPVAWNVRQQNLANAQKAAAKKKAAVDARAARAKAGKKKLASEIQKEMRKIARARLEKLEENLFEKAEAAGAGPFELEILRLRPAFVANKIRRGKIWPVAQLGLYTEPVDFYTARAEASRLSTLLNAPKPPIPDTFIFK